MSSQALSNNSLLSTKEGDQPYILYAITNRPPSGSSSSGSSSGGANSRDPIQVICPYTGSNITSGYSLRCPTSSNTNKHGSFGVRSLMSVPLSNMMGCGGDDINSTLFIGHGGSSGGSNKQQQQGGKDDHAFLLSRQTTSNNSSNNNSSTNPKWKVRLPTTLSSTPQSIAISQNSRYVAASSTNGSIYLWDWTLVDGDNLINVWKAHYRSITCLLFDDDNNTLFSAGEDGVVNAWCLLDLVDQDSNNSGSSIHPFQTWSEHHLPVTSLCILPGSGCGSTRLVSSSLDRNLIIMELGGSSSSSGSGSGKDSSNARTLARICMPSGIQTVITDINSHRLFSGGIDDNVYCIDLCKYSIQETLDGTVGGTFVNVNQSGGGAGSDVFMSQGSRGGVGGNNKSDDFQSLLSGNHVLPGGLSASTDQSNYVSELKGHVKSVTSLALLDPASLSLSSNFGSAKSTLLASGSDDGTLRIWDLNSRSCIKVLRPWSTSSDGMNITTSTSTSQTASSPPITSIIAVPKSSLTSSGLAISSSSGSGGKKGSNNGGDLASLFKPFKSFLRGTSVVNHTSTDDGSVPESISECTPILWPRKDDSTYNKFWEESIQSGIKDDTQTNSRKRAKKSSNSSEENSSQDKVEIARLKQALAESQEKIERWQAVNNQLMTKLKNSA